MIETNADSAFQALESQLEAQAAALAEARRQSSQLANAGDPTRWRRPDLLWPTFTGGQR